MQTKGEYRVRLNFNASGLGTVDKIKRGIADLIDMVDAIPVEMPGSFSGNEQARLKALAMTELENAGHWAVKAAIPQERS